MSKLKSIEERKVWQKAGVLLNHTYELSNLFPQADFFGLTLRFRNSASALSACLAEGSTMSLANQIMALECALKNVSEVRRTAALAQKLNYFAIEALTVHAKQCDEITFLTRKLIFTLKHK